MSTVRRPMSRRRRAAMQYSSPRGSMVTVEPSKPRPSGESRLRAISAPLPARGGARVMAEPSRGQAIRGAFLPLAPLAEQDAPALRQLAHGAPVQQRGPAVEVGLRAPAALAAAGLPEQMESRPAPEQGQRRDGRDREHQHDQPEPFQPEQPVQGGVGPLDLPDGGARCRPRTTRWRPRGPRCRARSGSSLRSARGRSRSRPRATPRPRARERRRRGRPACSRW